MIKAIITGATGMVGEGVLHEALLSKDVESVLVVNRKPCGVAHPKLKELIVQDLSNLSSVEKQLVGYNACFFCAGISSVGVKEEAYTKITYDLTLSFAKTLLKLNSEMTFLYVSGSGTDSTEKGGVMWARVKGKTENDLLKLGFKDAYAVRPGFMNPTKGLKNTLKGYGLISFFYPVLQPLFSSYASTLSEVGIGMIKAAKDGSEKKVLEVKDLVKLAKG
jgi:uncharacterized protein YbjT (DUF2867 family)